MRRWYILLSAAGLAAFSACGDSPLEEDCCRLLTSIQISPQTATLAVGDSAQFTATVRDEDNEIVNTEITWQLSNTARGVMSSNGSFRATTTGTTYVRSIVGVLRDSALVTITP